MRIYFDTINSWIATAIVFVPIGGIEFYFEEGNAKFFFIISPFILMLLFLIRASKIENINEIGKLLKGEILSKEKVYYSLEDLSSYDYRVKIKFYWHKRALLREMIISPYDILQEDYVMIKVDQGNPDNLIIVGPEEIENIPQLKIDILFPK